MVGEVVPAGVLGAGEADEEELLGVGDFVVVVGADEPTGFVRGLLEVAPVAPHAEPCPVGREVPLVGGEGGLRRLERVVPASAEVEEFGLTGQEVGVLRGLGKCGLERGEGPVVFPLALQGAAQADGSDGLVLRVLCERLVVRSGLLVVAAEPALPRLRSRCRVAVRRAAERVGRRE